MGSLTATPQPPGHGDIFDEYDSDNGSAKKCPRASFQHEEQSDDDEEETDEEEIDDDVNGAMTKLTRSLLKAAARGQKATMDRMKETIEAIEAGDYMTRMNTIERHNEEWQREVERHNAEWQREVSESIARIDKRAQETNESVSSIAYALTFITNRVGVLEGKRGFESSAMDVLGVNDPEDFQQAINQTQEVMGMGYLPAQAAEPAKATEVEPVVIKPAIPPPFEETPYYKDGWTQYGKKGKSSAEEVPDGIVMTKDHYNAYFTPFYNRMKECEIERSKALCTTAGRNNEEREFHSELYYKAVAAYEEMKQGAAFKRMLGVVAGGSLKRFINEGSRRIGKKKKRTTAADVENTPPPAAKRPKHR